MTGEQRSARSTPCAIKTKSPGWPSWKALAGAGFEDLWNFSKPNAVFTFVPFLLMGETDSGEDTTTALLKGRESLYLHHLWATFTGDKQAAPFAGWAP